MAIGLLRAAAQTFAKSRRQRFFLDSVAHWRLRTGHKACELFQRKNIFRTYTQTAALVDVTRPTWRPASERLSLRFSRRLRLRRERLSHECNIADFLLCRFVTGYDRSTESLVRACPFLWLADPNIAFLD